MIGLLGGVLIKGSILLFLLGFGYVVFINANKEEKIVKSLGRVIGIMIIASALIGGTLFLLHLLSLPYYNEIFLTAKPSCGLRK